ncbi:hypothetical protein AVEN_164716-1 [Araneus ventricosus]|uniref:Uncharacterized protein n=1 Tax=Araneus ventricosus TaxID=182803 RepID=A0A4Y2HK49_ARAVE|nr:hypothetical protein AVEN_164716-1 [Araneus ventricosus]
MFSSLAAPLTDSLKGKNLKGTAVKTESSQISFYRLKRLSPIFLGRYALEHNHQFILQNDSSDQEKEAVLSPVMWSQNKQCRNALGSIKHPLGSHHKNAVGLSRIPKPNDPSIVSIRGVVEPEHTGTPFGQCLILPREITCFNPANMLQDLNCAAPFPYGNQMCILYKELESKVGADDLQLDVR